MSPLHKASTAEREVDFRTRSELVLVDERYDKTTKNYSFFRNLRDIRVGQSQDFLPVF